LWLGQVVELAQELELEPEQMGLVQVEELGLVQVAVLEQGLAQHKPLRLRLLKLNSQLHHWRQLP
jgi:hypothetical protein